jgi:hypothetical protein
MRPRGGMMLGMSRSVRGGRVVGYEWLRIETREGRLLYIAHLSGQAVTEFVSVEASDSLVVFENPNHDFPQRILYRTGGADSLFVRSERQQGGETRRSEFRMARGRCFGPVDS